MATNSIISTSGNFNWNAPASWSLNRVPLATDDVSITGATNTYLSVNILATDPGYTVASLTETTSNTSASEFLNVGGSLTVSGAASISSGIISVVGNGSVNLNTVTLSNSAQINTGGSDSPSLFIGSLVAGTGTTAGNVGVLRGTASIQSISGSVSLSVSSAVATVGTTSGSAFFGLTNGRLNLLSTTTTLGDFVNVGNNASTVDLRNIAYQAGETYTLTLTSSGLFNTYQLDLKSALGQTLYTFQKVGGVGSFNAQTAPTVSLAADGLGGTLVTLACYTAGTAIAVPGGQRAVEDLAIGDLLLTAAGAARRLKWVGRRAYAGRFLQANPKARPIRFRASALADGMPRRDLLVSPEHAMFIDGALIPARYLVNGVSVVQDTACDQVEYFHLELDSHDVILAEGAPSETFVDDNSRMIFQNAHEFAERYGDIGTIPAIYCAERIDHGPALDAARGTIDARAGLTTSGEAVRLRGSVDVVVDGVLHGWAQDPARPEAPVCLDVLIAGVVVAQVLADGFRPDLLAAGMGSGCHAFRATLPDTAGMAAIEVRRTRDGLLLGRLVQERAAA